MATLRWPDVARSVAAWRCDGAPLVAHAWQKLVKRTLNPNKTIAPLTLGRDGVALVPTNVAQLVSPRANRWPELSWLSEHLQRSMEPLAQEAFCAWWEQTIQARWMLYLAARSDRDQALYVANAVLKCRSLGYTFDKRDLNPDDRITAELLSQAVYWGRIAYPSQVSTEYGWGSTHRGRADLSKKRTPIAVMIRNTIPCPSIERVLASYRKSAWPR